MCTFSNHPEQSLSVLPQLHAFHTSRYRNFLASRGFALTDTHTEHSVDVINQPHFHMQPSHLIYPAIPFVGQEPSLSSTTFPFIHFHHHTLLQPSGTLSHNKLKYNTASISASAPRDREQSFTVEWVPGDCPDCLSPTSWSFPLAHTRLTPGPQWHLL